MFNWSDDTIGKLIVGAGIALFGFFIGQLIPFAKWVYSNHNRPRFVVDDKEQAELILREIDDDGGGEPYEHRVWGFTVRNAGKRTAYGVRAQLNLVSDASGKNLGSYRGAFELRPQGHIATNVKDPFEPIDLPAGVSVTFVLAFYRDGPDDTVSPAIRESLPYFAETFPSCGKFCYELVVFNQHGNVDPLKLSLIVDVTRKTSARSD